MEMTEQCLLVRPGDSVQVRVAEQVNVGDLLALIQGEVISIRVKRFLSEGDCGSVAERMMKSALFGYYANSGAEKIGRVGQAFYESQTSAEARQRYENDGPLWMRQMRLELSAGLTPIDKLRLELDEVWPYGATIGRLDGRKMFAGLGRVFDEGSGAEPHQDILGWDAPNCPQAATLIQQLAANVYLTTADEGGELMIWPRSLTKAEYERCRRPGSYGVLPEYLPAEYATIQPEIGELILFCSRNVHAVGVIRKGRRATWSCFIGMTSLTSSLFFWS